MVDPVREDHAYTEERSRYQHHPVRTKRFKKPSGHTGARNRPQRTADPYDCEQPLALFLGVDVVRQCPELCDQHHIEQSDP